MLDIRYELKGLLDKYRTKIVDRMKDPNVLSDEEADMHTDFIHRCGKGDLEARRYVMTKIKEHLMTLITSADRTTLRAIIIEHFNSIKNKGYKTVDLDSIDFQNEEAFITYYQLMDEYGSPQQHDILNIEVNAVDEIDFFAMEIYKSEYGLSLIEELIYMKINNIEVHGTRKIRVETNKGIWYTIKDYHFSTDEEIKCIADRLYSQEGNGQITDENCEVTGRLLNGARLTITLKPGAAEHGIFIKKFDSVSVSEEEMLQNGTITKHMLDDLKILAKGRANSVFIGGVNTGKSTFLKIYVGLFPKHYKIGLVDSGKDTDLMDLYPDRDITTLYETDKYSLHEQFSYKLRMGRHIIIIGEARSYEISEMIKGMTRGNSGSCCSLHITNPYHVVNAIARMGAESGTGVDINVLREEAAEAVDIIIRLRHFEDLGKRMVDYIGELVVNYDNPIRPFELRPIYQWDESKKMVIKVSDYKPSQELEDKLRYYGCSDEDIELLKKE
ncbi:ATPase, T2SS/T4P/T4SS family [Clostridium magnum]|uniref:Type II/IV secretion system protein n=1 Tax=Clostridium magnum DSM 2767 TaxID=1121326 RepID=A0A161XEF3_9CLOT|nr:ATPase, T2SS/T4P/T4SS family [Clostridium magnum]KZL92796.1 type II/IV secretion system protein [Clostridium magnum DSM 2767]SHJ40219.1 Pilus assembly protein, ATPase of CpaF family [Clostridium magnum DSM 2767]